MDEPTITTTERTANEILRQIAEEVVAMKTARRMGLGPIAGMHEHTLDRLWEERRAALVGNHLRRVDDWRRRHGDGNGTGPDTG